MRVSKAQAQVSRQRFVETAALLFRQSGFDGIGIADLMNATGMTHGAFYRHFLSKDDLAAEATSAAYSQFERDSGGKSIEALLARFCHVSRQLVVWRPLVDFVGHEAAGVRRILRWIVLAVARRGLTLIRHVGHE